MDKTITFNLSITPPEFIVEDLRVLQNKNTLSYRKRDIVRKASDCIEYLAARTRIAEADVVKKTDWRGFYYPACSNCDTPLASVRMAKDSIEFTDLRGANYCPYCGSFLRRDDDDNTN